MRITFPVKRARLSKSYTCSCCGKARKKSLTVEHTVNPFNRDENGEVKSPDRVMKDARAHAARKMDAFMAKPVCTTCENAERAA